MLENKNLPEKGFLKHLITLLYICMIILPSAVFSQESAIIKLTAFDYPPFYFEEENRIQGIGVEIAEELFRRMDIRPVIKKYPLKRALSSLKNGSSDGMLFLIKTREREEYLDYSIPVYTAMGVVWSSSENGKGPVEFSSFDDLLPYKIGVTAGYSYGEAFDSFLKNADVDSANSDYYNYKKLIAGRIDIFPGNYTVAKGLFKKYPELKDKIVHSENSFMKWDLYMTVSKKSQYRSKIEEINKIIGDLITDGFIENTVRKYTE